MVGRNSNETASKKKPKSVPTENNSSFKSTEFVGDSDDADADHAPAQSSQKKTVSFDTKTTKTNPSSKPATISSLAHKAKKNPTETKNSPSTSEAETGSSEGDGGEDGSGTTTDESSGEENSPSVNESLTKARSSAAAAGAVPIDSKLKHSYTVKPVNGVKRKAGGQPSNHERDEEDEDGSNEEEDDVDESESGDGEDSGESSAAGDESSVVQATRKNAVAQAGQTQTQTSSYKPPAGFAKAKISTSLAPRTAGLFKSTNLEGKQIWHITAPSQLPVNSIREVSATSLKDGSAIISHEGSDYGLVPQTGKSEEALLVPSTKENQYHSSKAPLSRTLHIRQLVQLPNNISQLSVPDGAANESSSSRHQQPAGLQMRFRPFGLSSDSDSDDSPHRKRPRSTPRVQSNPIVERPSTVKKRKHKKDVPEQPHDHSPAKAVEPTSTVAPTTGIKGSDGMNVEKPANKQKLPKRPATQEDRSNKPSTNPGSTHLKESAGILDHSPSKDRSPEPPSSNKQAKVNATHTVAKNPDNTETPEQRAKRKEEKRRQKKLQQQQQQQQQQQSSSVVNETPSTVHKSSKRKTPAANMPLAEYSARLNSAEEARAAKPTSSPSVEPHQSLQSEEQKLSAEKAKRKEERRRQRKARLAKEG